MKIIRPFIYLLFLLLEFSFIHGQTTYQKTFGGVLEDVGISIIPTSDGGWLMAGNTRSYGPANNNAMVTKLSANGAVQWSRTMGLQDRDWGFDLVEVSNGYMLTGLVEANTGTDFLLAKISFGGVVQWSKRSGMPGNEYGREIALRSDSTLIMMGYSTGVTFGFSDVGIVRTDLSGNNLDTRHYGQTGNDMPEHMFVNSANEVVVAGYRTNYLPQGRGLLMKMSSTGAIQLELEYSTGLRWNAFHHVSPTPDGGYILAGTIRDGPLHSYDGMVLKVTAQGLVQWYKYYQGANYDQISSILVHPDGGYICFGQTKSMGMNMQIFVMRLDNSGNIQWQRNYGGIGEDIISTTGRQGHILPDRSLMLVGSTRSYGAGGYDALLLKMDSLGRIDGCTIDSTQFSTTILPAAARNVLTLSTGTTASMQNVGLIVVNNSLDTTKPCCPVPQAFFPDLITCPGIPFTLTDSSSDLLSPAFYWDLNNDGIIDDSSGATVGHSFSMAGTYPITLIVKNACGPRDTITQNITVSGFSITGALGPDTTICSGSPYTLTPGPGFSSYQWSTGATTSAISTTSPGTYAVTTTNSVGCTASDTMQLSHNPAPTVNLGPDVTVCIPGSVTLDAGNPGNTYAWSTGQTSQTITVNTTGPYAVTVTNAAGCAASDTVHVQMVASLPVNLGPDLTACAGTSLTLNAGFVAGGAYFWSTGETTQSITVNSTGNYWVIVTSPPGCSGSDTVGVNINPLPVVSLGPDTTFCANSAYQLLANGLASGIYSWSTGATTQGITVFTSGQYAVSVTDGNGCVGSDTVNLSAVPNPNINLGPDLFVCENDPVVLDATIPGGTYQWNTNATSPTLNPTQSGVYSVTVTGANGCTAQDSATVTFSPKPNVNLGADRTKCEGGFITLNAGNPGASYQWSNGANASSISVYSSGNYGVTVTVPPGCSDSDVVNLQFLPTPTVDLGPDTSYCQGDSLTFYVDPAIGTAQWNNQVSNPVFTTTEPGLVQVTVTNSHNCIGTDRVWVEQVDSFQLDLGPDTTFCSDVDLMLGTDLRGLVHNWSTGESARAIRVTEPGTILLTVENSCFTQTDSIRIEALGLEGGPYIPNAFTPNGDGLNDVFTISGAPTDDFQLMIFDRWGKLIFHAEDMQAGWDGTIGGNQAPEGVYSYHILYRDCRNLNKIIPGTITLLR